MISDLEARKIASDWHGGGGTALYAFSSTGAINTARADHDIEAEIADCMWGIDLDKGTERIRQELLALDAYAKANSDDQGLRGPVNG